jgi:hypothetical protein
MRQVLLAKCGGGEVVHLTSTVGLVIQAGRGVVLELGPWTVSRAVGPALLTTQYRSGR